MKVPTAIAIVTLYVIGRLNKTEQLRLTQIYINMTKRAGGFSLTKCHKIGAAANRQASSTNTTPPAPSLFVSRCIPPPEKTQAKKLSHKRFDSTSPHSLLPPAPRCMVQSSRCAHLSCDPLSNSDGRLRRRRRSVQKLFPLSFPLRFPGRVLRNGCAKPLQPLLLCGSARGS